MSKSTKRRKRLNRRLKRVGLGVLYFAVPALVVVGGLLGVASYVTGHPYSTALSGAALAILLTYVFAAVGLTAAANPAVPRPKRESLLWSWLEYFGRHFRGLMSFAGGLVVATLMAVLVGDGSRPDGLRTAGYFLALVSGSWVFVATVMLTTRAVRDVRGRRSQLQENLVAWFEQRNKKHASLWAKFFEDGATPYFIVMAGLGLVLLVLLLLAVAGAALGFG